MEEHALFPIQNSHAAYVEDGGGGYYFIGQI